MTTTPNDAVEALADLIRDNWLSWDFDPVGSSKAVSGWLLNSLRDKGFTITRAKPEPLLTDNIDKALQAAASSRDIFWLNGDYHDTSETLRAHIASLEAENKRLREAVEIGIAYITAAQEGLKFTHERMIDDVLLFEAALAQPVVDHKTPEVSDKVVCGSHVSDKQPEQQKCGTCGGNGFCEDEKMLILSCKDCDGTGKAGE